MTTQIMTRVDHFKTGIHYKLLNFGEGVFTRVRAPFVLWAGIVDWYEPIQVRSTNEQLKYTADSGHIRGSYQKVPSGLQDA